MDEREFVEDSRESWERLAAAAADARRRGVASLGPERLKRLHEDYRRAAADLAYAQTHFAGSHTARYLNALVGQAHGELYGSSPRRLAALWTFLSRGYPRLVRRNIGPMLLSAGLLTGAAATGFLLVYAHYPLARMFLPAQFREGVGDALQQGAAIADLGRIAPLLSAYITVNNIQVSLLAFAGGITFGALTVYALLMNGLLLGSLAGVFAQAGGSLHFWSLIVPHGALELPAIALAGGAGLIVARSLVRPGDLPRATALKDSSAEAARGVLGVIPLLVVAGLIEAFLTPRPLDPWLKIAFGLLVALAFAAYISLAGRDGPAVERAEGDASGYSSPRAFTSR